MKKALTIYIDDDCEFMHMMLSFTVQKAGRSDYCTTNQIWRKKDDGKDALYLPFEYRYKNGMTQEEKDRTPPLFFDDSDGTDGMEEVLNHD